MVPNPINGTQIGPYRVVKQIGAGGMGAVYLAEHVALGRRAAIKVLHPEFSHRTDIVTRFFNEARAATAISDPGIVQIFDFGHHTDGSAYIVMELLDGETLDRRLERGGPLPVASALRIMRQVASSLGAAHTRGIVHRDLKPENLFMVRDAEVPGGERPKILDFGIAKLAGEGVAKTQTSAVMGTPMYMSPEQCRGAGHVDQRSDVYSLGCVIFALLTGRPPFDAEGVGEIIAMHLREPAYAPSKLRADVPPLVDELVLRCLAKDPAHRFASGTDLAFALSTLLGSAPEVPVVQVAAAMSVPVHAAPTTLSAAAGESGPITSRSRIAMGGIAAGVAVVTGIVVFAIVHHAPVQSATVPVVAASADAAVMTVDAAPQPAASKTPDAGLDTITPFIGALERFSKWSRSHGGSACPTASILEDARDPWGHAFRFTCSDQPGDQIVGLISDGPDGLPNTADDVASWQLGSAVTSLVRGPRWRVEPPKHVAAKPAVAKPASIAPPAPPADPKPTAPAIEVDRNGIPISR